MKAILYSALLALFAITSFSQAQGWQQLWGALPQFASVSSVNDSTCWFSGDRAFVVLVTNKTKINWRGAGESPGLEPGILSAIFGRSELVAWTASGDGKIYKTTDGGLTWIKQFQHAAGAFAFFNGIYFWDDNNGVAWGDPINSPGPFLIMRTTNGGSTWGEITSGVPSVTGQWGITDRFDVAGNHIWFPSYTNADTTVMRHLYHSRDRGLTWDTLSIPPYFGNFAVSFSDTSNGLIADESGHRIALTTDGGIAWSVRYDGVGTAPLKFEKGTSNVWIQGRYDAKLGYSPIFRSIDFGLTWTQQLKPTQVSVTSFSVVNGNVAWVSGFNYLILRTTNGGFSTSINSENGISSVPISLELNQNYPNPFNPTTTIKYRLQNTGNARLIIYDAMGRQVRTLFNGIQTAGWHIIVWDGLNDARQGVSTGTYFYRIETNGQMETKKMILVK